ncbi:TetR/AcrR family transcriptional regulator [Pseudochryseolinea flava]|uniref:TetR family transcriptional regulator n=1 Tax=Pseudochryseolinea flava TaxID=2059302 RepID=A0A364XVT4_9BACT|nr:TetR/AcrR family transcriptional regulator [Pseudochryseolinea flava]RAV98472.1 TetR family transcriptional regulator [Pseudochryseolinea flava]
MSITARKERQKEELKGKILQAAKALFMEKGFEETSIRNIAEKIEYSPTTIYLYFKDKDDIFHALHTEGFVLLNQYFRPLAHVSDPFERLKAVMKAYINFAKENGEFYDLMFIINSPMKSVEKEAGEWEEGKRAFEFLIGTVGECIQRGYFHGMDAEVVAFTLWSMVHGICSLEIRNRCSVVSALNQEDLANKATGVIQEILERMHSKPQ